jgi:hypothetical protein
MGEVVECRLAEFFSGVLFGKRTANPERSSPTYDTSIDAVSAKDVPLVVSSINLISRASYSKTPRLRDKRISGLNVYARISAHKKHIETFDGSKWASQQDTQCVIVKGRL